MARDADSRPVPRAEETRHRAAGLEPAQHRETGWDVQVCRVRAAVVFVGHQVRERNWLAELLETARGVGGDDHRQQPVDDANRGPLRTLRGPPGPSVSRWSAPDRYALLHERSGPDIRAEAVKNTRLEAGHPAINARRLRDGGRR